MYSKFSGPDTLPTPSLMTGLCSHNDEPEVRTLIGPRSLSNQSHGSRTEGGVRSCQTPVGLVVKLPFLQRESGVSNRVLWCLPRSQFLPRSSRGHPGYSVFLGPLLCTRALWCLPGFSGVYPSPLVSTQVLSCLPGSSGVYRVLTRQH